MDGGLLGQAFGGAWPWAALRAGHRCARLGGRARGKTEGDDQSAEQLRGERLRRGGEGLDRGRLKLAQGRFQGGNNLH